MKTTGIRLAWLACALTMQILPSGSLWQRPAEKSAPRWDHPERGDVPGWVMITLMSAVLVAALLALAGPALEALFNQAMAKVGQ